MTRFGVERATWGSARILAAEPATPPTRGRIEPAVPLRAPRVFVPGHGRPTWAMVRPERHRAGGNGGGCRKLAARPRSGALRGDIPRE